jgi:hypothetical protein
MGGGGAGYLVKVSKRDSVGSLNTFHISIQTCKVNKGNKERER